MPPLEWGGSYILSALKLLVAEDNGGSQDMPADFRSSHHPITRGSVKARNRRGRRIIEAGGTGLYFAAAAASYSAAANSDLVGAAALMLAALALGISAIIVSEEYGPITDRKSWLPIIKLSLLIAVLSGLIFYWELTHKPMQSPSARDIATQIESMEKISNPPKIQITGSIEKDEKNQIVLRFNMRNIGEGEADIYMGMVSSDFGSTSELQILGESYNIAKNEVITMTGLIAQDGEFNIFSHPGFTIDLAYYDKSRSPNNLSTVSCRFQFLPGASYGKEIYPSNCEVQPGNQVKSAYGIIFYDFNEKAGREMQILQERTNSGEFHSVEIANNGRTFVYDPERRIISFDVVFQNGHHKNVRTYMKSNLNGSHDITIMWNDFQEEIALIVDSQTILPGPVR
jgi:hypothetical protein